MYKLPKWSITDLHPAFYDTESATAIEQTAKIYGAMNQLIDEYNAWVDRANKLIEDFENSTNKDIEVFKIAMRQEFEDFINTVELKLMAQDKVISSAISYMKQNLNETVENVIKEMYENGELIETLENAITNIQTNISKMKVFVTPQMFGAIGDGMNDDHSSFTNALSYANENNLVLFVPSGIYLMTKTLCIPENSVIIGKHENECIIRSINTLAGHCAQIVGYSDDDPYVRNITIKNITFDSNKTESDTADVNNFMGHAFSAYGIENVTFDHCVFKNAGGYGMGLQGNLVTQSDLWKQGHAKNVTLKYCKFINNGLVTRYDENDNHDGLDCKWCEGLLIEGCQFIGNSDHGLDVRGTNVIVVNCKSANNANSGFSFRWSFDIVVNNVYTENEVIGIALDIATNEFYSSAVRAIITNTTLSGCLNYGVVIRGTTAHDVRQLTLENIHIYNAGGTNNGVLIEDIAIPLSLNNIRTIGASRNNGIAVINQNSAKTTIINGDFYRHLYAFRDETGTIKACFITTNKNTFNDPEAIAVTDNYPL